jgi:hypothetical protein
VQDDVPVTVFNPPTQAAQERHSDLPLNLVAVQAPDLDEVIDATDRDRRANFMLMFNRPLTFYETRAAIKIMSPMPDVVLTYHGQNPVFWAVPPDRLNNDIAGLASKTAETAGHLEQADQRTFAECAVAAEEANKALNEA